MIVGMLELGLRQPRSHLLALREPAQRDRLRLDRYDEQDFVELYAAMKADGLWLL